MGIEPELFGEQSARGLDHPQIGKVVDYAGAVGVEKHDLVSVLDAGRLRHGAGIGNPSKDKRGNRFVRGAARK